MRKQHLVVFWAESLETARNIYSDIREKASTYPSEIATTLLASNGKANINANDKVVKCLVHIGYKHEIGYTDSDPLSYIMADVCNKYTPYEMTASFLLRSKSTNGGEDTFTLHHYAAKDSKLDAHEPGIESYPSNMYEFLKVYPNPNAQKVGMYEIQSKLEQEDYLKWEV